MEKIDINVLMIGKSGAGKSSLLNYLFGQEIEKTGAGDPVTTKGVYEHMTELNSTCLLHIYDTWGLEPHKTKEWDTIIRNEIKKHDVDQISQWFHFIIYCINAKFSKIEDFEMNIIKSLLKRGSQILVVFTNCDTANQEDLENMITYLSKNRVKKKNIIKVCSVNVTKIGGKQAEQFGKEELLDCIQKNFWSSICKKIPVKIHDKAQQELKETTKEIKKHVDKSITFFNLHSNYKYEKLNEYCSKEFNDCIKGISDFSEKELKSAIDYYVSVCKLFLVNNSKHDTVNFDDNITLKFYMDFEDKLAENLAFAVCELIPIINLFIPGIWTESKRDEYKGLIDQTRDDLLKKIDVKCRDLEKYLYSFEI